MSFKDKDEEIIEAEFFVIDNEDRTRDTEERHIWVLVGESVIDAKLAKVSTKAVNFGNGEVCINCWVSQIEGVDIEDAYGRRVFERFKKIPTKGEQMEMIKNALFHHRLSGEIWLVGERYAEGHKNVLKLQRRIKGGAHVSI